VSVELRVRGRVLALVGVTVVAVVGLAGVAMNVAKPGAGSSSAVTPLLSPSSGPQTAPSGPQTAPVPVSPSATIVPLPNYVSTSGRPEAGTPPSRPR